MAAKKRKRKNPAHAQQNPGVGLVIGIVALAVVGYGIWAVSEGIGEAKKKVKKAIDEAPMPDRTKPAPAPTPDRTKPAPRPGALTSDQVLAHIREILERETPAGQEAMTEMYLEMMAEHINDPEAKALWPCLMVATSYEDIQACAPAGGDEHIDGGDENSWEPEDDSWKQELEFAIDKERMRLSAQGKTPLGQIVGTRQAATIGLGENPYRYVTTIFKDMSAAQPGKQHYLGMVAVVGYVPYGQNAHAVPVVKTKSFLNLPAGSVTTTSGEHLAIQNELGHLADQTASQWS